MKRKDFWKGFGVALALAVLFGLAWKPLCRIIPWQSLPFEIGMSRTAKISMIEDYLNKYYVDDLDETLIDDMLYTGMMAGVGDRYTYYLTQESLSQYMENTNGHFAGIGVEIYTSQDGDVTISSVMEGEPA